MSGRETTPNNRSDNCASAYMGYTKNVTIDWNLARAFVTTAEEGSLSAAARKLGLTQPTMSRQVAAFEASLGVNVFERIGKLLVLTEAGEGILPHARTMSAAADTLMMAASSRSDAIEGCVRISAVDAYCAYIMPDLVKGIRELAPDLQIELVATNSRSNLQRGEADIAIRHIRPDADELIGKLALETSAGFYASQTWVDKHGLPTSPQDLEQGAMIGIGDPDESAQYLRDKGFKIDGKDFRLTSDNSVVVWELVKKGLGVSLMMQEIAQRTEGVVELFPDLPPTKVPVWLLSHQELRSSRKIRLVYDLLAEALRRLK